MPLFNRELEQTSIIRLWRFLFILTPPVLYYTWVYIWGINCPQLDDFAVLCTMVDLEKAQTLNDQLSLWFTPHNEHRIVFTRLIFWLVGSTNNGAVDIYKILFIGNLTLVGIASIFYRALCQIQQSWLYALAISCMLFQMQFFENTFFGMAAVQNLGIYFWLGLSFWKLTQVAQQPRQLIWALVWAIFATFTSGNGLVVFPAGVFILWFLNTKKWMILWIGFGVIITVLYLHNLPHQSHSFNYSQLLKSALGYLGSFIGASTNTLLPIFVGFLILVIGILLNLNLVFAQQIPLKVHSKQVQLFLLAFFIALLATSCMVGLNRDIASAISTPRYKIGSAITVCLIILMIANIQMNPKFSFLIGLGAATIFSFFCFMTYYKMTPIIKANRVIYQSNLEAFKLKTKGKAHAPIVFEQEWLKIWKAEKWTFPDSRN